VNRIDPTGLDACPAADDPTQPGDEPAQCVTASPTSSAALVSASSDTGRRSNNNPNPGPPPCNWMINFGNGLNELSDKLGEASVLIGGVGTVVAGVGAVTVQPAIAAPGIAMMMTGAAGGTLAGVAQITGGALQWAGGASGSNFFNGILALGAGRALGRAVVGPSASGYRSVSQRAADAKSANWGLFTGFGYDLTTNAIEDLGPQKSNCQASGG